MVTFVDVPEEEAAGGASAVAIEDEPASLVQRAKSLARVGNVLAVAHTVAYYSWIPFILYVGITNTEPRPTLAKVLLPIV